MINKPKLSRTIIQAISVGLIPFAMQAMDLRFINVPLADLAIILVPLIWLSLLIGHISAAKDAKLEVVTNPNGLDAKLQNQQPKEQLEIKKPKLTDTVLKGVFITIGLLVLTWIGLRLEHTAFKFMALALFLIPVVWCWLLVRCLNHGRNNKYTHGDSGFSIVNPMQDYNVGATMGPVVTAFQHNPLSTPTYQTPMMTRTPDYSLGPDSGMYTTRWN